MFQQVLNAGRMLPALMTGRSISQSPVRGQVGSYTPNNMEKRFLVWTGKYKNLEEVPSHVSADVMERCRNKMRIRIANVMIGLTTIGCFIMIYSGKQAAKRGESVTKQNLEWHKSAEVMERCRNKVRIRIANVMIALTIVGCVLMVYSGKEAAKHGDTVSKQNIEWHKRYNELHGNQDKKE